MSSALGPSAPPAAKAGGDASALPANYRIHEYEIERPLGGGGFGITYLARDGNLNLPVAIKEYFPNDLATRGANHTVLVRGGQQETQDQYVWGLERFLDEARALATFRHPNIVRVLRYFRDNGTAYIVMEYETGLALKRWVPQNAPLSQRLLLSIVRPLLDGLEQVHKSGFLHRDIKPDNIYVRADGSPVLLDFGSARRVQSNRELTNIVSPGFAPFEQYHSQGNQGPWTDIYSLGAVMYWMVTGKKPMESAARVKSDTMLPASAVAESSVYGEAVLHAIEWAMTPEETRRPQSVTEFRVALESAGAVDTGDHTQLLPDRKTMAAAGFAPSLPASGGAAARRNLLGTILFLDLVGYSIRSVDDQVAVKKLFTELITKALRGVPEDTRIAIDTGDGAAICFMGDPEEAMHSALLLRDLLSQKYGTVLQARIGLHMGPVRVIQDINDRVNVIGDGINVAQRVMDFAQPNQILVSRAYYDVISRITDDTAEMFEYRGQYEDKHGRMHEVYAVEPAKTGTTKREGPATGYSQTVPVASVPLDDDAVHEIEVELARHIGPLSKVLVKKARALAQTPEQLREALAPSIQEPKAREMFLAGHHGHSQPPNSQSMPLSGSRPNTTQPRSSATQPRANPSQPRSGPSQPSQPSQPSGPRGDHAGDTRRSMTQTTTGFTRAAPVSGPALDLTAEELQGVELALGRFIGPMARIVLKKESARSGNLKDLVAALTGHIDQQGQRDEFVAACHKALSRRNF
ncbi:protein kinase [Caenimonas sedimenti]|uniref:Protein kinase n=1 Tax=Caenimonas sedimenti TaxID=2596921 RepID=A0A562ZG51_9BURK|nr:protein kinase [Caenimonas sedimenti]TWO66958.1 protein kinase [Caenimonas sedimenti]